MRIGTFDTEARVLIVAEIGNNHEGRFDIAQELVRKAAAAGVGAVKFQTFRAEHYVSRRDEARFKRLKSFELSPAQFGELSALARSLGLLFMSTPFDLASVDVLAPIVDGLKISSGDNTFYPLIERAAATPLPLLISTGLTDADQVRTTVDRARRVRPTGPLAVLHCVTAYPVPPEQANLRAIPCLQSKLDVPVGYSDHTLGIDACVAAAALGAPILEKHFTLDHHFSEFRDHQISADPAELAELVRRVRATSALLGKAEKTVQPSEEPSLIAVRRSIVAGRDLPAGHRVSADDLTWIRPGGGIAPGREADVVGKRLRKAIAFGDAFRADDLE